MSYYIPVVYYSPNGGGFPTTYVLGICTNQKNSIHKTIKFLLEKNILNTDIEEEIYEELEYEKKYYGSKESKFKVDNSLDLFTNLSNYVNEDFSKLEYLFRTPSTSFMEKYCYSWSISLSLEFFDKLDDF